MRSQRSTYSNLLTDGFITEDTFERLVGEVDLALMESHVNWSNFIQSERRAPIKSLITVMVPHFDEENVINALIKLGFSVTRLTSEDRLLQHGNTPLLIGTPEGSENIVIRTLEENCSTSSTLKPLPLAIQGVPEQEGIDIFTFDVERFIEL
jgi:uncharacterized protein YaaQ